MAQLLTLPRFLRLKSRGGAVHVLWLYMYYVGGRGSDHKMALKGLWLYLNFLIDHDATQKNLTYNELKGQLFLVICNV